MKKLKWNKLHILKKYLNSSNIPNSNDKIAYEEMIKNCVLKHGNYNYDENYHSDKFQFKNNIKTIKELSEFQKETLKKFLNNTCNDKFLKLQDNINYKNNFNYIKHTFMFVNKVNPEFKKELKKAGKKQKIYVDNVKKQNGLYGLFYPYDYDGNYYYVKNHNKGDTFISLNHELGHGMSNKLCNESKTPMYDEALSILIELLANDYEHQKKLIDDKTYIKNYNNTYLFYVYESFYESLFTFNLIENDNSSKINLKKYKDEFIKNNEVKNFKCKDILSCDLEYNLTYMYSFLVAVSVYENYKNNPRKAIEVMLDILRNVKNKEREIFDYYNIDINNSINKYLDNNINIQKKKKMK